MEKRNAMIEQDGFFWESETHEWFHDHTTTSYAQKDRRNLKGMPDVKAFVLRDKKTGEYDRVLFDAKVNNIVYDTKSLEALGAHVDMLKLAAA